MEQVAENMPAELSVFHRTVKVMTDTGYDGELTRRVHIVLHGNLVHGIHPVPAALQACKSLLPTNLCRLVQSGVIHNVPLAYKHSGGDMEKLAQIKINPLQSWCRRNAVWESA